MRGTVMTMLTALVALAVVAACTTYTYPPAQQYDSGVEQEQFQGTGGGASGGDGGGNSR